MLKVNLDCPWTMLIVVFVIILPGLAPADRVQEVHTAFFSFIDANHDANISYVEFYRNLKTYDENEDGRLTHDEFTIGFRMRFPGMRDIERAMFHCFTYDRVGTILFLLNRAFYGLDIDSDGKLTEEEFFRQIENILANQNKIAVTPVIDVDNGKEQIVS